MNNESNRDNNNSSSDSNESSLIWKFADKLFGPDGTFGAFSDDNSMVRLEKCEELHRALDDCERLQAKLHKSVEDAKKPSDAETKSSSWRQWLRNKKPRPSSSDGNNTTDDSNIPRLEETRSGMKMSRFYGWNLSNPKFEHKLAEARAGDGIINSENANEMPETYQFDEPRRATCSIERHAYWSCRALAVQCGPDLVQLRKCFKESDSSVPHSSHYDDDDTVNFTDNDSSCRMQQMRMAKCVRTKTAALNERVRKRQSEEGEKA